MSRLRTSALVLVVLATCVLVAIGSGSGNPFALSAKNYVNSDFFFEVQASADIESKNGNSAWGEKAMKFAHVPSAYWLDTMAKVGKLMVMMEEAKNFAKDTGSAVLTSFVIYDVPTRDCYALSSNGEIQLTGSYQGPKGAEDGIGFYKSSYIDPIYSVLKRYDGNSPQLIMVLFIEPDSLPNIVTNKNGRNCSVAVCDAYVTAQTYTIKCLGQLKNVWMYMDLAHGGWLGYKDNLPKADGPFVTVLSGQENLIRGFVTNSANYSPLIFETGWSDLASKDTDYCVDELTYIGALMDKSKLFAGKNFIVDTGRNGKPGCRTVMGNWCNIYNTGIGKLPGAAGSRISLSSQNCPTTKPYDIAVSDYCKQYAPAGLKALDAVWWIKTPGESDGISENKPGARLDTMCQSKDSWWKDTKGSDAPEAGQWFHLFFKDLVTNAIETPSDVDLCAPNPCKNLGKCKSGKCTCEGGWTGTFCSVAPSGCASNPCKNYGTCQKGGTCVCAEGFSGDTCEITKGACDSPVGNQCFNGGACSGSPWSCTCKTGFSGTMCQDGPKCGDKPCKNGGSCFSSPLGYACFCPRGWMGTTCETSSGVDVSGEGEVVDPGTGEQPGGGGGGQQCTITCAHGTLDTTMCVCACPSGWEGTRCQNAVGGGGGNTATNPPTGNTGVSNPCASLSCRNGGTPAKRSPCVCTCPTGWSGDTCATKDNQNPSTNPSCTLNCGSTGTCVMDGTGVQSCSCIANYYVPAGKTQCVAVPGGNGTPTNPNQQGNTQQPTTEDSSSSTIIIILIILIVLAIGGGAGYYFYQRSRQQQWNSTTKQMGYGGNTGPGGYGQTPYGNMGQPPAPAPGGGYYGGGAPRPPPPRM